MKLKIIIFLLFSGMLSGLLTFAYFYVINLQQDRDTAIIQNTIYKDAIEDSEEAISSLLEDVLRSNQERNTVYNQYANAATRVKELTDKLSEHDIGVLAASKPKLVENIINRGTTDIFRCFEILSGSAITLEEIDATTKSQINNSCPDVANPNYIGN